MKKGSASVLARFFTAKKVPPQQLDANVAQKETVWLTLLALYILEDQYLDREGEWTLLAQKAKAFLKKNGVSKPDKAILKLQFDLVA